MRRWLVLLGVMLLLVGVPAGFAVRGGTFAMDEQTIRLPGNDGALDGVLVLPGQLSGPVPLVVFVHGDGPVDATDDGRYRPQFEALARAGVASVSWSKPGVGGSAGDWLRQDQADRVRETAGVIGFLRGRADIDPDRIGLWGAGQGGWVVPAVAAADHRIAFVIAVSPAINWMRQSLFHLTATLDHDHADQATRDAELASWQRVAGVLDGSRSYDDYLLAAPSGERMSRARWDFVLRNFKSDATGSLHRLADAKTPVLLILAGNDRTVDAHETEKAYRTALGGKRLTVRWFAGANHSLARSEVEDSTVRAHLTAIFTPRDLMAPGYLEALAGFAAATR
ncbi:alpha/beta hydrolase family protein [Actinoplanes sp. G11-F43]|uniref:alpha/beta hydrolase family protein n=1 Tax=Actinoplanes sp. G11-F43 TaxID=3424130 RepID=UPI003D339418